MYIRKLDTENRTVTVTMDYEDVRCISNSMFKLSTLPIADPEPDFDSVNARMLELFMLIKHGMVPEFELDIIHKALCVKPTKEGGN